MCQAVPTGLYTRWQLDLESGNFKPCQNRTRGFENKVMSYFQRVRPQCKVESSYATGTQKRNDAYSVDGFCGHCNTVFEAMGREHHYCLYQEARPSLTKEEIKRGVKKRELDELRKQYIQEKCYEMYKKCVEINKCDWCKMYKADRKVKQHMRESFPYKMFPKKKDFWKISSLEDHLVMFKVLLKDPRISEKLSLSFHPSSKILKFVEITFVHL